MNCPNCGSPLAPGQERCVHCGSDVTIHRRILNRSIAYYNDGLAKAKVRDLTGARVSLLESIRYDKYNVQAHNLLGLVYLETGEVVDALAQWVISKNLQPTDNLADDYLDYLRSNQADLAEHSQRIKKYNMALTSVHQNSKDLAIIQLKKIFAENPRFLRAGQLLALLYMWDGEYERARRILKKILKVDANNTLALTYRAEIRRLEEEDQVPLDREEQGTLVEATDNMQAAGHYREEKPNVFLYLNLLIGLAAGLILCFVLILPTYREKQAQKTNETIASLSSQVSTFNARYDSLQKENETLQASLAELQEQVDQSKQDAEEAQNAASGQEALMKVLEQYIGGDVKDEELINALVQIEGDALTGSAKTIYDKLLSETRGSVLDEWMKRGIEQEYNIGSFSKARDTFADVLKIDPANVEAIYYMGRSSQRMGENEDAIRYYRQVLEDYPDSEQAGDARTHLAELE